ncbi:UpxY family transcription antiterminator [Christiangramia salexigens]|uniref:Antitermination protein NusG n=1 Tax=Christiangramia salexigens TaxID=1913577 RepID=A0A1L3J5R9_9FLAO|nr:UpxY family transcription antiterminator [Christiangramia salexigens]APG60440.1 antitermination protein NusG [Christiangramia salexigens]
MHWYVVRTKPQHEIKTAALLEGLGVEVYCPVYTEIRQWSDRKRKVTSPLFKSYVFVKLEEKNRNQVFQAPGVLSYLHWLKKPAVVKPEEIEVIKSWLNNDSLEDFKVRDFKPGDEVEIKNGKLANNKAIVKETGNKTLKLLLPGLGWTLTASLKDLI